MPLELKPVEVSDNVPADPDKVIRGKVVVKAFDMAGGVPDGYLKHTAVKVGPHAWRVNIWTQRDTGMFVPESKIAHSFYITE